MDKVQALNSFWNGFDLNAYDATSVPEGTEMPYITYEVSTDSFGEQLSQTASIWYRSSSWRDIQQKEMEIADYIGRGGLMIAYDDGAMWLRKDTPWALRLAGEGDEYVRRIALNIELEFID